MKEYKVARFTIKFTKNDESLEDFLNNYAREGWILKDIDSSFTKMIFERDKNR